MRTFSLTKFSGPSAVFLATLHLVLNCQLGLGAVCVPVPGCISAWWPAEGDAVDAVVGNDGTLQNGAGSAVGMVGLAFWLDGTSQFVEVPNAPALNPVNEITLEAWVHPAANPGLGMTIISKDNESSARQYLLNIVSSGQNQPVFRFHVHTSSGYAILTSTNPVPLNAWTHVAATYNGSTMRLYVNGALDSGMAVTGSINANTQPLRIGRGLSEYFFKGMIDEVTVYSRALTEAEVQGMYTAGTAGKCSTPLPVFLVQPTNQTSITDEVVVFYGTAMGSRPLDYQWLFQGNPVPGATTTSLVLSNVQVAQSGTYSLRAANAFATVESSSAVLVVNPPPPCLEPGAGLVSQWRANLNSQDAVGGNDASWVSGSSYSNGVARQAFVFKGNNYLNVPNAPSLNPPAQFSFETWVYPESLPAFAMGILAKDDGFSARQYLMNLLIDNSRLVCRAHLGVGSQFLILTGTNQIPIGAWTHLAMTYDGGLLRLFVNGLLDSSLMATGRIGSSSQPVSIGRQASGFNFVGRIDEPSIYSRALSPQEIQNIYSYGAGGKCATPVPPFLVSDPTNLTATLGSNATLVAVGGGTVPLRYQWLARGSLVPGATNASFTLTNASFVDAGDYSVLVSNIAGVVTSSTAVVTLVYPPAAISIAGAPAASGGQVTLPVSIAGNGNENALAFSLSYDTTRLKFSGASLGTAVSGAFLTANRTQTNAGKVGLVIALPPDTALAAGTQQVVLVHFTASVLTSAAVTAVAFGDQPTPRVLLDNSLATLAANYSGPSSVPIAAADFEADVFPRPSGDRNITVSDWLLLGRYAARLAYPTNAAEFQRADCAGRNTGGDAAIKVTDWVQAGRYAFGFDPWQVSGGPTTESPIGPPANSSNRLVTLAGATLTGGETFTLDVDLSALGNENAFGFSIEFDSAKVSFAGTAAGSDMTAAAIHINTNHVAAGRLGFAGAFGVGEVIPPGTKNLLRVSFKALPATSGPFQALFGDVPIPRQTSDANAQELPTGYLSTPGTSGQAPSLRIWASGQLVNVAWPLWATNFVLQESIGDTSGAIQWTNSASIPVPANGENLVTVQPASGALFYRLKRP